MREELRVLNVAAVALLILGSALPAHAATFTVTKATDTADGSCDADCSLREAVIAANAAGGVNIIFVPAGTYTLTIAGSGEDAAATGDLDITGNLTISGAGAASTIIDGGGIDRVFHVRSGAMVVIDGITVRNGHLGDDGGGGILNQGTLTLTNSTVSGNTAGYGGGILNNGPMAMNSSIVSGNAAAGAYGSSAQGLGGGIFNINATMAVIDSTVSGNTAGGVNWFPPGGGGIFNELATLTVSGSTVSGNTAGGGIVNLNASLAIQNGTVSDNTSSTGYGGGGILNFSGFGGVATTAVISSTVAENKNTAGQGDAIADAFSPAGSFTVKNSILASPATGLGGDCYGAVTSLGHNIASDGSCALGGTGDLNSTDPLLGPLADNGGPTMTHGLLAGSPAINAVPLSDCTDSIGGHLATDQRGINRPQGAACDTGALELVLNHPPVANAGPDQIVEATSSSGASVTLDGSGSSDLDDDPLTYDWTGLFGAASGVSPAVTLSLGSHTVTLSVSDGAATATDSVNIMVRDTTPPSIGMVTAAPNLLWPPDHRMVPVTVTALVSDLGDAAPVCQIISVTSNEPENGLGDGDTAPDWEITGRLTVNLRAERSGTGSGRAYTITVRCADASGNSSTKTATVTVPKSKGKK